MRNLGVLVAVVALAACGQQHSADEVQDEQFKALLREGDETVVRMKREHLALMQEGQGCPGEVLRGEALKLAVVGKAFHVGYPRDQLKFREWYYYDGIIIKTGGDLGRREGRYWFVDDKVCQIKGWCYRLIRTSDGTLKEEILNELDMNSLSLVCLPLVITGIGENQ